MPDDSAVSDSRQIDNMRRQFLKLAGVSIGMSGLAGCGGDGDGDGDGGGGGSDTPTDTAVPTEDKEGGTLSLALNATWETLFPMKHAVAPTYFMEFNVAPRLATYDFSAGEVQPGAASDWEWIDDEETTLQVTLNEGMTFHPGPDGQDYGECTAEDVVWTINSIVNDGYGGGWIQKFLWPTPPIEGAEEVDEYTFNINMEQTYVPIIVGNLTNTFVISKEAVNDLGDDFAANPISVGPYQVADATLGQSTTLERFEDGLGAQELGYSGPGYADEIVFEFVGDAQSRLNAVRNGELDMVPSAEAANLRDWEGNDDITVYSQPAYNFDWLYVGGEQRSGTTAEALNQVEVRQAIGYAVDRTQITDTAYFGYATPDDDMLTKEFAEPLVEFTDADEFDLDIFPLEADPDQAQSLLEDAGYTGIELEITHRPQASETRAAQVIQQNLSAVEGISSVSLNQLDAATFANVEREGDYDVLYSSLSSLSPDYEQVINYYLPDGDLNSMGFDDQAITDMINESRLETDREERMSIFRDMFEAMVERGPWTYLCHTTDANVFSPNSDADRDRFSPLAGYLDLTDAYTTE